MLSFIIHQYRKISEGGWERIKYVFIICFFFPIYYVIRLISPTKLIRFGVLNSYRIGHFAGNTEMYMCDKDH